MEARHLPIPNKENCAHVLNGQMRELWEYNILRDSFRIRWDTVINGVIFHFIDNIPYKKSDDISERRELAFQHFRELEGITNV